MQILIATKNKFKRKKLTWIIEEYFSPLVKDGLKEMEEHGNNFFEIAQNKAIDYSKLYDCMAISTDGGAVIPSLNESEWEPIKTKRFGITDEQRITKLLDMMQKKMTELFNGLRHWLLQIKGSYCFQRKSVRWTEL